MLQKLFDFFVKTTEESGYIPTAAGNIAIFILAVLLFFAMAAFTGRGIKIRVRQLTVSAMAITLAVVFSYLKLFQMPYGGSVTFFTMFFICLIGYLYGTKAGILAGIAYGFINLILGPSIYYPVQMLLDYPIAFGCLGLAGIFSHSKYGMIKGLLLGVSGRFVAHVLSGVIFFYMYAPEGWNPLIYSLWYNATYIVPDLGVTIFILLLPPVQNALKQVKRMVVEE
jgi:thiamine transporter